MRSVKRMTALIMTVVMTVSSLTTAGAATAKATTLRLEQTEGTATLKNANGTAKSIKAGMKLYNGDNLSTDKSSYAYISLDSTKAVKVDEGSSVSIKQSGTENEVFVNSGSLMFNVTVPLAKKESLNIRTSTMVTGVRGTIGYAQVISEEESEIYILEGKVELTSIDSKTGNDKTVAIQAGEKGVCRLVDAKFDKENDTQVPEVKAEKFTEENITDYVVVEVGRNLDVQERLRKDGKLDVDKILDLYKKLGDTGTYITIGTAVTPNSVSANRPVVTPNAVSDNESSGGGGGGGGGGGSAGGGGGAANNTPEAAAPEITLATASGGAVYAEGEAIGALSVVAEVDKADAYTTYQWYVANSADGEGTAVEGATDATYTPDPVLGTRYFYCVVKTKLSSSATKASTRESNRVMVAVKQATNLKAQFPENYTPIDANIGFTSITLDEIALQSVGSVNGSINEAGSKITLSGLDHSSRVSSMTSQYNAALGSVRADKTVFNDPGDTATVNVVEYAKSDTTDAPESDDKWQTDRTFTGLTMGTTYYFFARVAATDTTFAGEPSDALPIATRDGRSISECTDGENHLIYEFDIRDYDGSVSANAAVRSVDLGNNNNPMITAITIPESYSLYDIDLKVTEIADNGFRKDYAFIQPDSITLPDTIERIGNHAFFGNERLTSITIPDSVKEIDEGAFGNCIALESAIIGDGVTEVGEEAFQQCSSLVNISLGKKVKDIKSSAFRSCANLTEVTLKSNVESIGEQAFAMCENLKRIDLNTGLKSIGANAFSADYELKEIVIPSTLTAVSGDNLPQEAPFYSSGIETIFCALKKQPAEWHAEWNVKDDNGTKIPTYWFEEDTDDPSVVRVYSPESIAYSANANDPNVSPCTQLTFDTSVVSYEKYIDDKFLDKMFQTYNTVIIPDDNIAILDSDLTIPESKTLYVRGDLSTCEFEAPNGNCEYEVEEVANTFGNLVDDPILTNEGTLIIEGNLFTSNQQFIVVDSTSQATKSKSSIIISPGKIEVTGNMTVFHSCIQGHWSYGNYSIEDPTKDIKGMDCPDITISSEGMIRMYKDIAADNHSTSFDPSNINGMAADQFTDGKIYSALSKTADTDRTDSFKLKLSYNSEVAAGPQVYNHFVMNIIDKAESYTGTIYDDRRAAN